ncbi:MAG: hypothetical protein IJV25_04800 [Prevotella sp.]|nr:hypothetical protein [Prevotella sp.]
MNSTFKDSDLREALRRKYADTPPLPADFMTSMERRTRPKRRAGRIRVAAITAVAIAACIALLVLLVKPNQAVPEKGTLATTHVPRTLRPTYLDTLDLRTSTPSTHVPRQSEPVRHKVRTLRTQKSLPTDSEFAPYGKTEDTNLHYAASVNKEDTTAYQDPARMDEFIAKLAEFNKVKAVPLHCSSDPDDSTIVSTAYVFEDGQKLDLFARLLQVACWYDTKTPGYLINFSRQQFFFTLKDLRKGEKYIWITERLMDGRILLFSTHSPIEASASLTCYQAFLEQLTNTDYIISHF